MSILNNPGFYVTFALLQALVLIVLVRVVDPYERQPLATVGLVAAWGATGAAALSLAANSALTGLLSPTTRAVFGAAISPPVVEELAKGVALLAAAAVSAWAARRFGTSGFGGVTGGLVFGMAVGLGFAFTEDFFYFLDRARTSGLESGFQLFLARREFFGPQSLHHPLFTAPFGAALGLATWVRTKRWRVGLPVIGILCSIAIHAVNNGLVEAILTWRYGLQSAAAYVQGGAVPDEVTATAWSIGGALRIIDYTYIALALAGIIVWQRYQRRAIFRHLRSDVASGLVTSRDRETVVRASRRLRTYAYLLRKRDFDGWRRLRAYHRAVAKLGLVKWRVSRFGVDQQLAREARRQLAALRAVTAPPGNVPISLRTLVGRSRDVDRVAATLQRGDVRLVTLAGPGGCGRTSVALEIAARFADLRPGGAYYASTADPAHLLLTLARLLELQELPGRPLVERLADAMAKPVLLVVDQLEDTDHALAQVVGELLDAAPRVQIVTTARQPLGVSAETTYEIQPLPCPGPDHARRGRRPDEADAVALFTLRALAVQRTFLLDEQNTAVVGDICREVGGLPLAIELAAAWVKFLPLVDILNGLRAAMDQITAGASGPVTPDEQMEAAFVWAYGLLDAGQRDLLHDLSVFPDGCAVDAVEIVGAAPAGAEWDEIETVISLVERNLVRQVEQLEGEPRWVLLPTIRRLVRKQRPPSQDGSRKMAAYFADLAERAEPDLDRDDPGHWKARFDLENENLRAALQWSEDAGEGALVLRTGAALLRYWEHGVPSEGRRWLEPSLERAAALDPLILTKARLAAGDLALIQCDVRKATAFADDALQGARATDDAQSLMRALWQHGWIALFRGDYATAATAFDESTVFARRLGDDGALAAGLTGVGRAAAEQGGSDRGRKALERALKLRRFLGDDYGEADSLANLGRLALAEGRHDLAVIHLEASIDLSHRLGDRLGTIDGPRMRVLLPTDASGDAMPVGLELGQRLRAAESLQTLALTAFDQAELRLAVPLVRDRMLICDRLGDRLGLLEALECFAVTASGLDPATTARLAGYATVERSSLGVKRWQLDEHRFDAALAVARHSLRPEDYAEEWKAGEEMSIAEASSFAVSRTVPLLEQVSAQRSRAQLSEPTHDRV